jgi:acyl-CoA thioester hydrolase
MGQPFAHTLRVRYAECDPQGVVFNAHYLAFFDASITELWRAAFGGYQVMMDRGIDLVVADAQLRFRSPARFDDELTLAVEITRMGNTSIVSTHRITRGEDEGASGELIVEGTLRHVTVERTALGKTPIPDWLRDQLAPWTVEGVPADN